MHRSLMRVHTPFLFPIIFNRLNLRVAMATEGAGMERKKGAFSIEREGGEERARWGWSC